MSADSRYLLPLQWPARPQMGFVLFPHAGSHANYFCRWREHLPPQAAVWAVQLPGRMNRSAEPFARDFDDTTHRIADAIEAAVTMDAHFFGHSLGGLLAFGTSLQLQRRGWRLQQGLGLSGCAAPSQQRWRGFAEMNAEQLTRCILAYGGIPDELLRDRELLDFFLPTLKADLLLLDSFSHSQLWRGTRLDMPMQGFCGRQDRVACAEKMADWRLFSTRGFSLHEFDGGHFYLANEAARICGHLVDDARAAKESSRPQLAEPR